MLYRVDLSPRAVVDLDHVFDGAENILLRDLLEEAILSLENMPERCLVVPKLSTLKRTVRQLLVLEGKLSHTIYFSIAGIVVNILHVRHSSRRPLKRL